MDYGIVKSVFLLMSWDYSDWHSGIFSSAEKAISCGEEKYTEFKVFEYKIDTFLPGKDHHSGNGLTFEVYSKTDYYGVVDGRK